MGLVAIASQGMADRSTEENPGWGGAELVGGKGRLGRGGALEEEGGGAGLP